MTTRAEVQKLFDKFAASLTDVRIPEIEVVPGEEPGSLIFKNFPQPVITEFVLTTTVDPRQ